MANHDLLRTVLIVCEEEGTEPQYFNSIKDVVLKKNTKVRITISPLPKGEEYAVTAARKGGRKRSLKVLNAEVEAKLRQYEIESAYKAQPVRYVREAQMGLEENTFDEVWAVFDKDGHPRQKEAFELAAQNINGRCVNIGFNSVCFEVWCLLHFEQCANPFEKSKCREGKNYFECGTKAHESDCNGVQCVCGYMVEKNYLNKDWNSKEVKFLELPDVNVGFCNAVWLRGAMHPSLKERPMHEINPYTTVDRLVFSILQLPEIFLWQTKGCGLNHDHLKIEYNIQGNEIIVVVQNTGEAGYMMLQDSLMIYCNNGNWLRFGSRQLITTFFEFRVQVSDVSPVYFAFQFASGYYVINDV